MSSSLTSAIIRQSGLRSSCKLVLDALVHLVGPGPAAVLGMDMLAREAGMPVRSVSRALRDLELLGLVMREPRYVGGRRDGVIRSWSRFRLVNANVCGALRASRAVLRDRLDAAFAVAAVRQSRRMAAIWSRNGSIQRSATSAVVLETGSISFLWSVISGSPEGSAAWSAATAQLIAAGAGTCEDDFRGFARA